MYLRAGVISIGLLLASRVAGLLRESVQAASFGSTALGDMAVLMLTLPDLVSAVFVSGALSYALLPWWARQDAAELARTQRAVARLLLAAGAAVALAMWLAPLAVGRWLAPGAAAQPALASAIHWAALAVPAGLLGTLWYTRLQHERDVVGMYGMNLVHTGTIIVALLAAAWLARPGQEVHVLGAGLALGLGLRLVFLAWRLRRVHAAGTPPAQAPVVQAPAARTPPAQAPAIGLPGWRIWLWATLATAGPAALMLVARTLASRNGEGSLAAFNYAWKLVELPNLLAIQLVAALAFPALTRAHAQGREFGVQLRAALSLSWALACAAALALWIGSEPLAALLFGWGRMGPAHVAEVAHWAAWGGWMLLPQALATVAGLVLATMGRLRVAALAYAAAVAALLLAGAAGLQDGVRVMQALACIVALVAAALLWSVRAHAAQAIAGRDMAVPAVLCALFAGLRPLLPAQPVALLAAAGLLALALLAASYAASPILKMALKR